MSSKLKEEAPVPISHVNLINVRQCIFPCLFNNNNSSSSSSNNNNNNLDRGDDNNDNNNINS